MTLLTVAGRSVIRRVASANGTRLASSQTGGFLRHAARDQVAEFLAVGTVHGEAVREEEDPQFGRPWPEVVVDTD